MEKRKKLVSKEGKREELKEWSGQQINEEKEDERKWIKEREKKEDREMRKGRIWRRVRWRGQEEKEEERVKEVMKETNGRGRKLRWGKDKFKKTMWRGKRLKERWEEEEIDEEGKKEKR